MSLEYSYLLTSQLDSQRIYYENQMDQIAAQLSSLTADTKSLLAQADQSLNENKAIENENVLKEKQIQKLTKVKAKTENDLENWKEETQATKTALLKEKEVYSLLIRSTKHYINAFFFFLDDQFFDGS
jgi:BRCA1-associated protein